MKTRELQLSDIVGYLPYGLKVTFDGDEHEHELVGLSIEMYGAKLISAFNDYGNAEIKNIKPFLYDISCLI